MPSGTLSVAEPHPPHGTVYYSVAADPYSQQPLPGYEACIPLVPAYYYVSSWFPVNPSYGNSTRVHNAVNPGQFHQVGCVAPSNPAPHYVPQSM